jgi:type II secretory pathway pseudopilin PulG
MSNTNSEGFTVVEMIVTIVIASLFLTFFIQMFRASSNQQQIVFNQSIVNDIAKSNLDKFPSTSGLTYTCDTNPSVAANTNNLAIRADAPGTTLLQDSSPNKESDPGYLGVLNQTVKAYSPLGCAVNNPVKIESRVQFGPPDARDEVVYATYIH